MFQVVIFIVTLSIIKYYQHCSNRLQVWLHFKSQIGIIFMTINSVKAVVLAIHREY